MDIYQLATTYWDSTTSSGGPIDPNETPAFDPRPEVPVPNVPEETPPYEKEPETPPYEPSPELPSTEPVIPEVDPLPAPGGEPDIPGFK
ncbi:MAG: filamentous hemagglutinin [Dyadobacter sp.]|uniref:filamentous hemagglutinin n=1 Tax=Dyadobacter sp. TaxID=1914288 RepID=UPI003265FD2F